MEVASVDNEIYGALSLLAGGFFFVTLLLLAIRVLRTPDAEWERARRELLEKRKTGRAILRFLDGKE